MSRRLRLNAFLLLNLIIPLGHQPLPAQGNHPCSAFEHRVALEPQSQLQANAIATFRKLGKDILAKDADMAVRGLALLGASVCAYNDAMFREFFDAATDLPLSRPKSSFSLLLAKAIKCSPVYGDAIRERLRRLPEFDSSLMRAGSLLADTDPGLAASVFDSGESLNMVQDDDYSFLASSLLSVRGNAPDTADASFINWCIALRNGRPLSVAALAHFGTYLFTSVFTASRSPDGSPPSISFSATPAGLIPNLTRLRGFVKADLVNPYIATVIANMDRWSAEDRMQPLFPYFAAQIKPHIAVFASSSVNRFDEASTAISRKGQGHAPDADSIAALSADMPTLSAELQRKLADVEDHNTKQFMLESLAVLHLTDRDASVPAKYIEQLDDADRRRTLGSVVKHNSVARAISNDQLDLALSLLASVERVEHRAILSLSIAAYHARRLTLLPPTHKEQRASSTRDRREWLAIVQNHLPTMPLRLRLPLSLLLIQAEANDDLVGADRLLRLLEEATTLSNDAYAADNKKKKADRAASVEAERSLTTYVSGFRETLATHRAVLSAPYVGPSSWAATIGSLRCVEADRVLSIVMKLNDDRSFIEALAAGADLVARRAFGQQRSAKPDSHWPTWTVSK